jgi:hypothetical protein
MRTKTVRPTSSYSLEVPEGVREEYDNGVASFWEPGESLLLQLSSHLRLTGEQVAADNRLHDRLSNLGPNVSRWKIKVHPDPMLDQATAESVDKNGLVWVHSYLVWTHLSVYATISGPANLVKEKNNWALQSLRTLRLTTQ